jgi:hypothetical protein
VSETDHRGHQFIDPLEERIMPSTWAQERLEDIEYWWSGGFPGAFAADYRGGPAVEPKLYAAFRRVLLAMPDDDFDRFLSLRPTLICQPAINSAAYSYHIPVFPPKAKEMILRVLYFRPDLSTFSEDRLARLVAHEVAHLILGHAETGGGVAGGGDIHGEEAADRQAEAWGFRGAYSMAHRRRHAERHKRAKERRRT